MAIFNNMSITNKGQALYAKAQAGTELKFTKMMVGSGQIENRNPAALITLIEPKFDIGIQQITPNTELKTATINGTINNSGIAEATYICEIGLFAEDPDEGEILYAYGTAGQYGDYYAPESMGPFSWNYQINAAIGNAANVTVELSNLTYDYGVFNTNTTFIKLTGGNQKEINKSIDSHIANLYKLSTGTVYPVNAKGTNNYTGIVTGLTAYEEPLGLAIKIPNDSTDVCSININGLGDIPILKANGNAVTNMKAGSIYTVRYNGTNFILQGEGGSGNATAADILAGKTAGTDAGDITGTMADYSAFKSTSNYKNLTYKSYSNQYLFGTVQEAGYYPAGSYLRIAAPAYKAATTITPGTGNQTIAAGTFLYDLLTIKGDSNLVAGNIKKGVSIFGVTGNCTISSLGGYIVKTGTVTPTSTKSVSVTDLGITPKYIFIWYSNGYENKIVSWYMNGSGYRTYVSSQKTEVESYNYTVSNGSFSTTLKECFRTVCYMVVGQ